MRDPCPRFVHPIIAATERRPKYTLLVGGTPPALSSFLSSLSPHQKRECVVYYAQKQAIAWDGQLRVLEIVNV